MSISPRDLRIDSFYLVESSNRGILALKQLPEYEYNELVLTSEYLHKYHYQKRRLREVELNLDDFFNKYQYYESSALTKQFNDKHDFFELAYVDLNRVLTNFLSSFRLYVDNLEKYVSKTYGKPSQKFDSFKAILSHEFHHKFEYRFLYALRNYSQHKYFPIGSVGLNVDIDSYSRMETRNFTMNFDKEKFNSNRDNFRHILDDLNLYNKLFPVLPQLSNIKKSIDKVSEAFLEIEKDKLVDGVNKLTILFQLRENNGELGFAKLIKGSDTRSVFDSIEIPLAIIRVIYFDIEGAEMNI